MKIAGIDVSRNSVTVAVLSEVPDDLRQVKRGILKFKADAKGIAGLLALEFDCAILEPSGVHYSRIWAHHLTKANREVRWVDHQEIANYRKSWKVANKTDKLDAIALACYGLERYNRPKHFIQSEKVPLRSLWLQLKHLNRSKNPVINRLRQQLAAEFPEVCEREVKRAWLAPQPPGLWRFLAQEKSTAKWEKEQLTSIGIGISEFSRGLARQLCEIERQEHLIEIAIKEELDKPQYAPYLKVFDWYAFGARTSAAMLSEIYPLERFLDDRGRQINEYLETETGKRGRRNRSLGAFKLSCGLGLTYYQSGDSQGWKAGGNADIRTALWQWCKVAIVISPNLNLPRIAKLRQYYENGSTQTINGEQIHFQPGIRNQKIMRVVRRMLEMLYKDLLSEIVKTDSKQNHEIQEISNLNQQNMESLSVDSL